MFTETLKQLGAWGRTEPESKQVPPLTLPHLQPRGTPEAAVWSRTTAPSLGRQVDIRSQGPRKTWAIQRVYPPSLQSLSVALVVRSSANVSWKWPPFPRRFGESAVYSWWSVTAESTRQRLWQVPVGCCLHMRFKTSKKEPAFGKVTAPHTNVHLYLRRS